MSTSKKHREFVGEPMGDKPVTDLAGIDQFLRQITEGRLNFAYTVLGQFLILEKNNELFVSWIKDTASANQKQANDCYSCLKEWCDSFL
ncbi:putative barrier-to-autointegration factor B-like [Apostichopus japonicus]|uniref:Barrier-to-autointegration factor-like protein n=1 Tax=Stichopus japonicus TaxID=307972 RepID=A0A2G8JM95_STIJA|nr:putative barrier-to-autointegration factor B-like [Apostichopus japonicus]